MTTKAARELKRTITIGRTKHGGIVEITAALSADGRFSAQGSVWNHVHSDITSGGQNLDHIAEEVAQWVAGGREALATVRAWWQRWHLNDMRAGCEHQRAGGWAERPIDPSKPLNSYGKHFPGQRQDSWNMLTWVPRGEHPEGLLSHPCPTCGYKYGSQWLKEEIPADVQANMRAFLS